MPTDPDILTSFDQPFQEALDYFAAKGIEISPTSWKDLWKEANQRAFTVAQVTAADVLTDIKTAVETAIEDGQTLAEFKKNLTPILERKGWLTPPGEDDIDPATGQKRLAPWRTTTIYRTNLADAYSVGRYKQQAEMAAARPYLTYHNPDDPSSRDHHAAMNGKTYPFDHPIWGTWYPTNGFNCRCWVSSHTQAQAESMTIEDAPPTIDGAPVQPDEGFDYNPGQAGLDAWKPDMERIPEDLRDLYQDEQAKMWTPIPNTQKGTNPGGLYTGPDGQQYYGKFYPDPEQAKAEKAANSILDKLNVGAPRTYIEEIPDKNGDLKSALVTEWLEDAEPAKNYLGKKITATQKKQLTKQYLGAALNNNWDVVGFDFDNLVKVKNKWYVIDSGGSFAHKATGGTKPFTGSVDAFDDILQPGRKAGKFFGPILEGTLRKDPDEYIKWLDGLSDRKIKNSIQQAGLGDDIADTLIARRDDLKRRIEKFRPRATKPVTRDHLDPRTKDETVALLLEDAKKTGVAIPEAEAGQIVRDVRDFTSNTWYKPMRHSQMGRIDNLEALEKANNAERFIEASARFPVETQPIQRGMAMKRAEFDELDVGDMFDPKALASWSTQPSTASQFAGSKSTGVVLETADEALGDHCGTIRHLSNYNGVKGPDEKEVLMSGRVVYRITEKREEDGRLYVRVVLEDVKPKTQMRGMTDER